MRFGRLLIIFGLACISTLIISSCEDSKTIVSIPQGSHSATDISNQTSASESDSKPIIQQEDLVFENLEFDGTNTHVTGNIPDFMQIDAEIFSTVDPMNPGSATSYTATYRTFSEPQRLMFVQPGWTLIESEFRPASFPYDDEYIDVYEDESGNQYHCNFLTEAAEYCTSVGELIRQIEVPADYYSQTDFEFLTEQEAFEVAKAFAETYGYSITDYHHVNRLPYEELEFSSRTMDKTVIDTVLTEGWSSDQNAYEFTLFVDVDGLPLLYWDANPLSEDYKTSRGTVIDIIVTPLGVEYARFYFQYENTKVESTGEMCSIEDSLCMLAKELYLGNLHLTPPIEISKAYLAYIAQWEPSTGAVLLRPFWVFDAQETGQDSFGGAIYFYVDALSKTITDSQSFSGPEL